MKLYTLMAVDVALKAILADTTVPEDDDDPSTFVGGPSYDRREIAGVEAGMVPRRITWSGDRGNWMWDGALHMLKAIGVDPEAPL